jgi:hypothetical protein
MFGGIPFSGFLLVELVGWDLALRAVFRGGIPSVNITAN